MPTPYTGVPTAVQAPATQPGPGVLPIFQQPIDGDNDNAATWGQWARASADYIAWLMAPKAVSGNWAAPTWYPQNARGQQRFFVDHTGYPGGRFLQWQEQWSGAEVQAGTGTLVPVHTTMDWSFIVVSTAAGSITVADPATGSSRFARNLAIALGTGGGDLCQVLGTNKSAVNTGTAIAMEWDTTTGITFDQMHLTAGMTNVGVGGYSGPTAGFIGAMFYKTNATPNWMFVTGDGTALSTAIDTGITVGASTIYPMRIEWLGSGVSDDGVSAARGYINGALVATVLTNLPNAPAHPNDMVGPAFFMQRDTGSGSRSVFIGPVRWSANY